MRRVAEPLRSISRRVGAHVSTAGGLTNALTRSKEIGGNCLQIFAGSPRSWARKLYPEKETSEYLDRAASEDLNPVFIHALYLVNLATDNLDLLKKSVESLICDLKNGDALDSAGVIVHVGSHQGRGFDAVLDQVAGVINQIINATEETPFIIENSAGQKGKIGSLAEISQLFNKVNNPRLKLCLDSAHLFESGYDLSGLSALDSLMNELVNFDLLDHLVCLHLNDSKTALSSKSDIHANLGEGQIGLAGLSQFVNHHAFAGLPIILEVPGDSGFPDAKQISLAMSLAS